MVPEKRGRVSSDAEKELYGPPASLGPRYPVREVFVFTDATANFAGALSICDFSSRVAWRWSCVSGNISPESGWENGLKQQDSRSDPRKKIAIQEKKGGRDNAELTEKAGKIHLASEVSCRAT